MESRIVDSPDAPSGSACLKILETLGPLPTVLPDWRPQSAPGSRLVPPTEARRCCTLLNGWRRLVLPASGEAPEPPHPVTLPDPWPVARNYHHAWYALHTEFEPDPAERLWLLFDAVAHVCVVFVNGHEAGRHLGGYTPFELDITTLARPGLNTLVVWMQDETAVADEAAGRAVSQIGRGGKRRTGEAGMRGGVYLECRPAVHQARLRIRPSTRQGVLKVETWIRGRHPAGIGVRQEVFRWPDGDTPVLRWDLGPVTGDAGGAETRVEHTAPWENPDLWSPEHPHLYVLRTTIVAGDRSESIDTRFGFREFWIEGRNFMLNGIPIRLFGDGDTRQELLSLVPDMARDYGRKTLEFLKREFHFNSIRLHASIFPRWACEAADEAGYLVANQSAIWSVNRPWYNQAADELLRNLAPQFDEWYWRDVNNPSVVIWDVENEIIRDKKTSATLRWTLALDQFIRRHDPEAIIQHSGAAWYHPDQQIIHVHMQEQYSRILREWRDSGTLPLVLGEFWMGGRGETRLPNACEFASREDWHKEEARLYAEKTIEMRNYGASGIMSHRVTHWPLVRRGALLAKPEAADGVPEPYQWRFPGVRAEGARPLAPVIGFVWPRHATEVEGHPLTRDVVVCNDGETACALVVTCTYGAERRQWELTLAPAEQRRLAVEFAASRDAGDLVVEVRDAAGRPREGDRLTIHALPPTRIAPPALRRRLVVVPDIDPATARALDEWKLPYAVAPELPEEAADTLVLVPPGAADDALGRSFSPLRRYLAHGGRLLALAQTEAPRWLPAGLPFCPAVRPSAGEFDRAGWPPTNRDLTYSREVPLYAAGHPAFDGLQPCDFREWSPVDGRVADDVFVRPNAANMRTGTEYRALLGATRRENASVVEIRVGGGTGILCQARILEQRAHPGARALFGNLLRYLDGPAWTTTASPIGLLGNLAAATLSELTGIDAGRFVSVDDRARPPSLILAGDRADEHALLEAAGAGATVLVLSCETCARLPGYVVEQHRPPYTGTRAGIADHPLFWGVASASFLPIAETPVRGALATTPPGTRRLLGGLCRGHMKDDYTLDIRFYGLETQEEAPPVAVAQAVGRGELIASTLEPWNRRSESHRHLLLGLLANAGIARPHDPSEASSLEVKRTVPLQFDGVLDDWTNDMEDDNLSPYAHAAPLALAGRDAVEGRAQGDRDLSAILYLLHDERHLFIGGIVFSLKPDHPVAVVVDIPGHSIRLDVANRSLTIDEQPAAGTTFVTGSQPAGAVIDTRLLNLVELDGRTGRAVPQPMMPGSTFETAVPWTALGLPGTPERLRARFRLIRSDGVCLQQPPPSSENADTLCLRFR